ncbi:MAG: barstar family protein [Methanosphaera sp.]|nr:barstar family protein [Methanosphaera sp.]
MKIIILDGKKIKKKSHSYLKKVFDFPDYYGKNLDALYDCLTDISVETEIHLTNSDYVSLDMIDTFFDASVESDYLTFICDD